MDSPDVSPTLPLAKTSDETTDEIPRRAPASGNDPGSALRKDDGAAAGVTPVSTRSVEAAGLAF
jgi:hypothetical protein